MGRHNVGRKIKGMKTGFVVFSVLFILSLAIAVIPGQGIGIHENMAIAAEEYTLTINILNQDAEPEGGSVELKNLSDGSIEIIDPPGGSRQYSAGVTVVLKAIPGEDYEFDRWGGALGINDENPADIMMDGNKTVIAYFRWNPNVGVDSDEDGISDKRELEGYRVTEGSKVVLCTDNGECYRTDPTNPSSDGDPYSDFEEAYGVTLSGTIDQPYRHPLVAARPIITLAVTSDFKIVANTDITDSYGETYGTSETWTKSTTSSWSIGGNLGYKGEDKVGLITGSYSQSETEIYGVTISESQQWSKAFAYNTAEAAFLKFSYELTNRGSASVDNLRYRLNIYIGRKLEHDYTKNDGVHIAPGDQSDSFPIAGSGSESGVPLTLDQFQAIMMGMPIRVELVVISAEVQKWDGQGWVYYGDWTVYEDEIAEHCITLYALYNNGVIEDESKRYGQQYEIFAGPYQPKHIVGWETFYKDRTLREALDLGPICDDESCPLDIREEGSSYIIEGFEYRGQEYPSEVVFVIPEDRAGSSEQDYLQEYTGDNLLDLILYNGENSDENCRGAGIYMLACRDPFVEIERHFFYDEDFDDDGNPDGMLNIKFKTNTYLIHESIVATVSYVRELESGLYGIEERDAEIALVGDDFYSVSDKMCRLKVNGDYGPELKHPRLLAVEAEDVYGNRFHIPMPQPRTIYVTTGGNGDGSRENPYGTIQKGIDNAVDWDTVVVMNGTYTGEGNVNLDFGHVIEPHPPIPGWEPPVITKAITVRSENGPGHCIIDCGENEGNRGFYFHSGETSYSVVEGFKIRRGKIKGEDGGGIYCSNNSHPTIANCVITENEVIMFNNEGGNGAGIGCDSSSPRIINCDIIENKGHYRGGGIYCANSSNPVITDTTIRGNWNVTYGGGIACVESSPNISRCIIETNRAGYGGGGVYCNGSSTNVTITNTIIRGNFWCERGGGIYCTENSHLEIVNTEITKNRCGHYGGGIYCNKSVLTIINATIAGNSVTNQGTAERGGGIYMANYSELRSMTNTILWANWCESDGVKYNQFYAERLVGSETFTHCDVQGTVTGTGNVEVNPVFVDPPNGDYHLGEETLCVNGGTWAEGVPTTDLDGRPRSGLPDIGAYEYNPAPNIHIYVSENENDTNDGSQGNPYRTIQMGIDRARDGDTVFVLVKADKEYTRYIGYGNVNLDFKGKAITVRSQNGPEKCIIDCGNNSRGFYFHSNEGPDSKVNGFTIRNGNANEGGGIYCSGASPAIDNMIIEECKSSGWGAGIFCAGGSSPDITNTIIRENETPSYGAIACFMGSSPTITNTVIAGNESDVGGGISCVGGCSPSITNTTITGNTSRYVIYCRDDQCSPELTNTIVWGNINSVGNIYLEYSTITLQYCDVEGGYAGTENIDADPLFVNADEGNYRLSDYSPCIGAGVMMPDVVPTKDIVGVARPTPPGSDPDIGAYESERGEPLPTIEPGALTIQTTCPVDLEITDPMGNTINKGDTSAIPSAIYTEEDLNGDGDPDDKVTIGDPIVGNYLIAVEGEQGANPADTYTLQVFCGDKTETLADNVPIGSTPDEYTYFCPVLNLPEGWNLISLPLQPEDTHPGAVLSSIDGKYNSIWAYDTTASWSIYAPGIPSDLSVMEPRQGYWIKMDEDGTLILEGTAPATTDISLEGPAWNLVGYCSCEYREPDACMSQVVNDINSVWEFDPDTGWTIYAPGRVSDLTLMKPGYGYWVKADANCVWDVNAVTMAAPSITAKRRSSRLSTDRPVVPYVIWGSVEADGTLMTRESKCTVTLKLHDQMESSYQLGAESRFGDSYMLEIPADNNIQAELYVCVDNRTAKAIPVTPGEPGQIRRFDLSVQLPPKVSMLKQNYPNPFNPDTWIPYQLKEDASVMIKIYSSTGQLVRTLDLGHKPAGYYTAKEKAAHWDGRNEAGEPIASGIYFYSVQAGDYTAIKKMAIVR